MISYKFGKYDGEVTLWKPNGQLEMKAIYKEGQALQIPYIKKDTVKANQSIPVF
jgi:antitoxin component YwqK of YwqJK toxin-antitoxin module